MPSIVRYLKMTALTITAGVIAITALVVVLSSMLLDEDDEYYNYRNAVLSALMDAYKFLKRDRVFMIMDTDARAAVVTDLVNHVLATAFKVIPHKYHKRLLLDVVDHMSKLIYGEPI